MKLQVEYNHYFNPSYDEKGRFCSYWHQIDEIRKIKPNSVLEIGIGNGIVANYLKQRGCNVTTLDIDERLKPDKVGSIIDIPFPKESFEVVACFEVLEHLPYENFNKALTEIHRVSIKYAALSLPDSTKTYRLNIQIPKIGELRKLILLPKLKPPKHEFNGEHYWEIGKAGYPLAKIMNYIRKAGFKVEKTYRVYEYPYHRFFILEKAKRK